MHCCGPKWRECDVEKELTLKFLATMFEEQRNGGLAVGTKLNNTKVKRVLKTPETESQNSKAKKSQNLKQSQRITKLKTQSQISNPK